MVSLYRHSPTFEAHLTSHTWCVTSGARHSLLNWITVVEPGPAAEIAFRDDLAMMRSRGLPALIYLTSEAHAVMEPVFAQLGFAEPWQVPMLLAELGPITGTPTMPNLQIGRVNDAETFRQAVEVTALAFFLPVEASHQAMNPGALTDPHTTMYAATRDGQLLGMTVLTRYGSLVYVDIMATLPTHQRGGIGFALLAHALNDQQSTGASHAFLIASQEGLSLYTRLGFKHVASHFMYVLASTIV